MFVHKQRETRQGGNKRREWETKRRGMRRMRGEVNGVETNLKIPLQGWFLVQLCESSCSNPRIYAPTGNCKCKLRRGNYVFTDLCIREKQTSRSFHVHVDFRFSLVLSRYMVSPCLRFVAQTIFRHERYWAITKTGDGDNAVARENCIRKYYRAHVFSEVDRNKPSACRDANRKCNVGSKERQRTCSNNNTKLHCEFVVVRCMTSDGLLYILGIYLGTISRRK